MKPSRARRLSDQCGVEELVRKNPNIKNPFDEGDRRYRMFECAKSEHCQFENLLNDMGGINKELEE